MLLNIEPEREINLSVLIPNNLRYKIIFLFTVQKYYLYLYNPFQRVNISLSQAYIVTIFMF